MKYLAGFAGAILLALIVGATVVWGGLYNVAASEPHRGAVRSVIDTALVNSVQRRAEGLQPPRFTRAQLEEGYREFAEYCVHCHGAPGSEPHEWTAGMRPEPPDLSKAARQWSTAELFWIVKHGIKMTGMPAFGETEPDETIWSIAGFVKRLPDMSPEQYAALEAQLDGGHSHGGEAGHGH